MTTFSKALKTALAAAIVAVPVCASAYQIAGNLVVEGTVTSAGATNTFAAITGSADPFPISGLAAAQGGAVSVTGGASSTTTNVGGAASVNGGAPGATSAGGAVSINGAVGGATSGAGGSASVVGGAATAGNSAGGAAIVTGGAGSGSQAGGAITVTSGAAGATGVAGAVSVSVGAATAGNGSAVTITSGNGAGGTASGGNINLVTGTAVSTGAPGKLQINGAPGTFDAVFFQPLSTTAAPATGTSSSFFLATRKYYVVGVSVIEAAHGTSETYDVIHDTSTSAPGAGTSILTAPMDPHAASETVVVGSLTSTVSTLTLAAGDRLSFKTAGTTGSAAGVTISVTLVPM